MYKVYVYVWSSHIEDWASTNMVANPARGQLNREISISLFPSAPENLMLRDRFGRPVPRQPPLFSKV